MNGGVPEFADVFGQAGITKPINEVFRRDEDDGERPGCRLRHLPRLLVQHEPQPLGIASRARNIRPIASLTSDWLRRLDLHSISSGLVTVGSRSLDQTAKSTPRSSASLPRAIVARRWL